MKKLYSYVLAGHGGYHVNYIDQPAFNVLNYPQGTDVVGNPTSRETSNSLNYGPAINPEDRPQNRYEMKAYATFIPIEEHLGGTHQLKFGTTNDWEFAGTRILHDKVSGDYQLQFNRGAPSQIVIYNYPFATSINNLYSQAAYITDSYGIGVPGTNIGGGAYKIDDGTGSMWVLVTDGNVPNRGAEIGVKGRVGSGINWKGRNYGLGIYEEQRKYKKR